MYQSFSSFSRDRVSFPMTVAWSHNGITHQDRYFVDHFNCWRDPIAGNFPADDLLAGNASGTCRKFAPGTLVPAYDPHLVKNLPLNRLNRLAEIRSMVPGRYYPQGWVSGLPGVFMGNLTPFLCADKTDRGITGDFNHPLAGIPLTVTLGELTWHEPVSDRGGACTDWMDLALTGPGMQKRGHTAPVFTPRDFFRSDTAPDPVFYRQDRFVHHIDDQARQILASWYASRLADAEQVLDLMAGWESHLPEKIPFSCLHGIGLNGNELAANPRLTGYTVQDLNRRPALDFTDNRFDAVICSLSVEYLTDPVAVFTEVNRVLTPGGVFAVTFSNRWFPEKAIEVWAGLHEFERMGRVLDYFRAATGFEGLETTSIRGYPRPETDKYFPSLKLADPLFAVSGKKRRP